MWRTGTRLRFRGRLACLGLGAVACLGLFAAPAGAVERISILPGLNGSLGDMTGPDANGIRYLGGYFNALNAWNTGGGALTNPTTGSVDTSFPKVNGNIWDTEPDGSGGVYIGGNFACIGPRPTLACNGPGDFQRTNVAHINADGTVSSWAPQIPSVGGYGVNTIEVVGGTVYLGGEFSQVNGQTRSNAAAVDSSTGTTTTAWNPNVNGVVRTLEAAGGTIYLGGHFTSLTQSSGAVQGGCASGVACTRNRAAAVDTTNGYPTAWDPNADGRVFSLAAAGGTVYMGGEFNQTGGQSVGNAVAVNGTTGAVDNTWNPNIGSGYVGALDVQGGVVYIGGAFGSAKGTARENLAAVETDGDLTSWAPSSDDSVYELTVSGETVYVGGAFQEVSGQRRSFGAAIGTDGSVKGWNPHPNGPVWSLSTPGEEVYIGGSFNTAGGTVRNFAAAVDSNGRLTGWTPDPNDGVDAIELDGETVYLGGFFDEVGGLPRSNAAAVGTNGSVTSWSPNPNSRVQTLGISSGTVYMGGLFTNVGGQLRNRAAAVGANGITTAWNPNPNGIVNALEISGGLVYLGGDFTQAGAQSRSNLAAVNMTSGGATSWDPGSNGGVDDMEVLGSTVFITGFFSQVQGTPRVRAAGVGTDGTLTAWNPNPNSYIFSLGASGNTIYLGGDFTNAGGQARPGLAAVNDTTGSATSWNPSPNGPVYQVTPSGSTVFLSGSFTTLGGQSRGFTGAVGTDGSILGPWPLPQQFGLSVTRGGTGTGTVTSSPAGIECGVDCSEALDEGTVVTLTGNPSSGSTFTGWSGACTGTGTCQVTMSAARNVTATFTADPPDPSKTARISSVTVVGPSKVRRNRLASFKVTVRNDGDAQATGVRLAISGKGVRVTLPVGAIAAGSKRTVTIGTKFTRKGKVKATFKATSSNAGTRSTKKTVKVVR